MSGMISDMVSGMMTRRRELLASAATPAALRLRKPVAGSLRRPPMPRR